MHSTLDPLSTPTLRNPFPQLMAPPQQNEQPTAQSAISIDDSSTPDLVTVKIERPDGRSLRRSVPRECWTDLNYREALIADMKVMLA